MVVSILSIYLIAKVFWVVANAFLGCYWWSDVIMRLLQCFQLFSAFSI